jgi:hypothetical protein
MTLPELRDYIIANGFENVQLGGFNDAPNKAIAIALMPGVPGETQFGTDILRRERPRIRITVRGEPNDFEEVDTRATRLHREIGRIQNVELTGVLWERVTVQSPYQWPSDKNQRPMMVFHVNVTKALSP